MYSVLGVAKSGTLSLLPYPRPQCSESIPGPLVLLLLLECSSPGVWWQMPHLLLAKCHLLCKAFPDSSAESSKLGLPWWSELRLHAFIAGGAGSIPGPVSKIRLRPFSLACRRLPSHCVLGRPFLSTQESLASLPLLIRTPLMTDQNPT